MTTTNKIFTYTLFLASLFAVIFYGMYSDPPKKIVHERALKTEIDFLDSTQILMFGRDSVPAVLLKHFYTPLDTFINPYNQDRYFLYDFRDVLGGDMYSIKIESWGSWHFASDYFIYQMRNIDFILDSLKNLKYEFQQINESGVDFYDYGLSWLVNRDRVF